MVVKRRMSSPALSVDEITLQCASNISPVEDRSCFQGSQRPPLMFANYGGSEISSSISFTSEPGRWL